MTSTNQIFDIRRFWKYICYDLRINDKRYLRELGITALLFLFVIVVLYFAFGNLIEVEADEIALYLGLLITAAIRTRERAGKNTVKKNGLEYLISVPASNFEKFLNTALIQVAIGLLIGFVFALLGVAIYTITHTNDFSVGLFIREFNAIFTLNHIRESKTNYGLILILIYSIPLEMSYILRNKVRPDLKRIYAVIYFLLAFVAVFLVFMPVFFPSIKVTLSLILLSIIIFYTLALIYFYFVLKNISYNEKTSDNAKKIYF